MAPSPSTSVAPARTGQRSETTSPTTSTSDRTAPSTPSSTATNHYRWRLRQPCAGSGGAASIKSPIFGSALTAWVAGRSHLGRHLRGERSQVVAGRWLRCRAATLPWCSSSADGRAAWAAAILTPARPVGTQIGGCWDAQFWEAWFAGGVGSVGGGAAAACPGERVGGDGRRGSSRRGDRAAV